DLAIIELNGGTSESTNIYDPEKSIRFLYATLFRQWNLLFQIGYANRRRGQPVKTVWRLLMEIVYYLRRRTRSVVAD
ncbi:MAG: carboxylate--amine ligase, partial [Leptospiraceae bacterium]|nr:carboxylate--amine ligase [Leptospiraceae bacterium]